MAITITFSELTYNSDSVEGKGHSVVGARFVNKDDAIAVCNDERWWKKHGVWGGKTDPQYDVKEVVYTLFENKEDFFNYDVEEVKKKALAKLTNAEKIALGLKV